VRRARFLGLAGVAAALATPAAADETRASADVSAGAGWSNNPFAGQGGQSSGSGFAQLGVSPSIRILNERRVVTLGGDVFHQEYFNDFGGNTTYDGYADYSERVSDFASVHARAGYSSARLGTFGFGGLGGAIGGSLNPVVTIPTDPVTGVGAGVGLVNPGVVSPVLPGAEVGAFGAGQRQRTLNLSADFSAQLSTLTSLTGSGFYLNSKFGGRRNAVADPLAVSDYDGFGTSIGLQRRISEQTNLGVLGSVAKYNYGAFRGTSRIYSIQGTASTRLSPFWTLDGALGVSFIDEQRTGSSTTLSGNASLCRRERRGNVCFQAARSVLPTGFAGTQVQTSVGVSGSRQLGEFDAVSLSASYVDLGGGDRLDTALGPLDDSYALANATYSRSIGRRLRINPSIYYRKVSGGNIDRDDDYGGQVSLSYRLGDIR